MKGGSDNYRKPGSSHHNLTRGFQLVSNQLVLFRLRTFVNMLVHLVFGTLYAFEHNNQVELYSVRQATPQDSSALGTQTDAESIVYTPTSNIIIMGINLILAILVIQITVNIDSQIEHI